MRKELEQKLIERWPTWFNVTGDVRNTGMTLGFRHDDGWFDIIWRLCGDLEPLVAAFEHASGRQFGILEVMEKFGGLRIHMSYSNDAIRRRILVAERESFRTCEVCGQRGKWRGGDWIKTLCDEHDASQRTNERGRGGR